MMSCEHHDYIEIACTFKLAIELKLNNGQLEQGRATDILNGSGREYLVLSSLDKEISDYVTKVDLMDIKSMTALVPNPHFERISFG